MLLSVTLEASDAFLSRVTDRVIDWAIGEDIGRLVSLQRDGRLAVQASLAHEVPEMHVRHLVHLDTERVASTLISMMQGYRPDVPPSTAVLIYTAVMTSDERLPDDVIATVGSLTLFGTVTTPQPV